MLRVVLRVVSNLECFLGELLGVVPELAEGDELDDVALHLLAVVDQRIVVGVEHILNEKRKEASARWMSAEWAAGTDGVVYHVLEVGIAHTHDHCAVIRSHVRPA
jgi:hypothetical protein